MLTNRDGNQPNRMARAGIVTGVESTLTMTNERATVLVTGKCGIQEIS